jgi:hypothetical protein
MFHQRLLLHIYNVYICIGNKPNQWGFQIPTLHLPLWRFSVTTLAFTAPGTLSHAVYIKYLKLGFLKVPKAVTTTQVVVTAGVVSEVSHHYHANATYAFNVPLLSMSVFDSDFGPDRFQSP